MLHLDHIAVLAETLDEAVAAADPTIFPSISAQLEASE